MGRTDKDLLQNRERWLPVQKEMNQNPDDRLRMFFDGLCKYARYSTFEVCETLRNADLLNSANIWDASTGQGFSQYAEHQKRAWSVDFSQLDPTKLASGNDDHSVKLWTINERKSVNTIRNVANVCCVQFSPHSANLAFGSADYKTYCHDLCNIKNPWCTLSSHGKAVSYI
ncbi:hypothetical protein GIB67_007577 [Kingdonia uniflora]|uniref:Uncharacterized protein n=1 Tax=Kingdonia uniflora TaxID=39325 RepID=A0A7J7N1C0_9MAGN|nr:hypothetical protein GIB67_007577 [Kingdonia uniflora]